MHFFTQSIYLGQTNQFLITLRFFLDCKWKLYIHSFLHALIEQLLALCHEPGIWAVSMNKHILLSCIHPRKSPAHMDLHLLGDAAIINKHNKGV